MTLSRRSFIATASGVIPLAVATSSGSPPFAINPRSMWGSDLAPTGPLPPEDVRFLIVHHSASHIGHTADDVPDILRGWYRYHTGPSKGWPDIAYNFVIDSAGGVWEGRKGSVERPIAGSATGGNQGFSQLVCVIGDTNVAPATTEARQSLVSVLAWLADTYSVSTAPGAQVTFTSRGSNRWPEGALVTAPTIVGHRDMSRTSCPGEGLYSYVTGSLSADVERLRTTSSGVSAVEPMTTSPTTTTPSTSTTTATDTTARPDEVTTTAVSPASGPPTTSPIAVEGSTRDPAVAASQERDGLVPAPTGIWVGAIGSVGAMILIWRYRRMRNR